MSFAIDRDRLRYVDDKCEKYMYIKLNLILCLF